MKVVFTDIQTFNIYVHFVMVYLTQDDLSHNNTIHITQRENIGRQLVIENFVMCYQLVMLVIKFRWYFSIIFKCNVDYVATS